MRFLIIFLVFSLAAAQFDWAEDGVPVRQGDHIEWQRGGDIGDADEMIIVWSDTRYGDRDIFVQKINNLGERQWNIMGAPVVIAEGRQEDPIIISDGNGGCYCMWVDYEAEPEDGDIYGQHINADGEIQWDPRGVPLSVEPGKQVAPNMSSDGAGGAFAIWDDKNAANDGHIYATHMSPAGVLASGTGIPIITSAGAHGAVSIESSGSGYAMLVWEQWGNGDFTDLYAQRIDTSCDTQWTTPEEGGIMFCSAPDFQYKPKVNDFNGDVSAVVWEDRRNNPESGDIYIQLLDSDGNSLLAADGEPVCDNEFHQFGARVKADDSGAYIVWEDKRYGDNSDIYIQRWTVADGAEFDDNGFSLASIGFGKSAPRLTTDGEGGTWVVWEDERENSFPQVEIYVQHVDESGTIAFDDNGLLVCDAENLQFNPLVRSDGSGGALVCWGDKRTGSIGLYVQHLDVETGITLEPNGIEIYYGIDGHAHNGSSVYLGNDQAFLFWQDERAGSENPLIYGVIVDENFDDIDNQNGLKISENPYQENPKAVRVGDNVFMNFKSKDSMGTFIQYYIVLDNQLTVVSSSNLGEPVYAINWAFNQDYSVQTTGSDDHVYFAYSDLRNWSDYDVYVQKINDQGVRQWDSEALLLGGTDGDDIVQSIEPMPDGGCVVVWQGGPWDDLNIYANAFDSSGEHLDSWGTDGLEISAGTGNQSNAVSVSTDDGILIVWKDTRNENADLFGQFVDFDGNILGDEDGFVIADALNDQQNPAVTYNPMLDEVLICWEDFENGLDFDLNCRTFSDEYLMLDDVSAITAIPNINETQPFVYTSMEGNYMIAWEDTRNTGGLVSDIFYQEYQQFPQEPEFAAGGIPICDFVFKQESPKIDLYAGSTGSYMIYWDDSRSSGKEDLINIYAQSRTLGDPFCHSGDVNFDGSLDILDIVSIVGYILGNIEFSDNQVCAADYNADSNVDILDIVGAVAEILE